MGPSPRTPLPEGEGQVGGLRRRSAAAGEATVAAGEATVAAGEATVAAGAGVTAPASRPRIRA